MRVPLGMVRSRSVPTGLAVSRWEWSNPDLYRRDWLCPAGNGQIPICTVGTGCVPLGMVKSRSVPSGLRVLCCPDQLSPIVLLGSDEFHLVWVRLVSLEPVSGFKIFSHFLAVFISLGFKYLNVRPDFSGSAHVFGSRSFMAFLCTNRSLTNLLHSWDF